MTAAALLLVPLLPLLLAAVVALPRGAWLRHLTPWAALPALLVALFMPEGTHAAYPWLLLGVELRLDATARAFLLLTSLLWGASGLYALDYLRGDAHELRFHLFFLLAMAGNLGLVLAADAAAFYAFFALMSLASWGLVVHAGGEEVRRAGRIYLILAVAGEVALFSGLVLHAATAGGVHFALMAAAPMGPVAAILLVAGFGIKAGLVPLHVWLPLAHPAAPTPASAVLSGAMIKAGLLGGLRLLPAEGPGSPEAGALLLALGLSGAFFAVLAGVMQTRPKTVLAYSSISQMGLMISGLGLALLLPDDRQALLAAVMLYVVHHGLAKGALFLGVGVMERTRSPRALAVLVVPALALAGLPWTSGALAKQALKSPLYHAPAGWVGTVDTLLALAAAGTTLLMARFLWCVAAAQRGREGPARRMHLPWLILSFAPFWPFVVRPDASAPAWSLIWPILAGSLVALAAAWWYRRHRVPVLAEGDLLVPLERLSIALGRRARASAALWRAFGEGLVRARFRLVWRRIRDWAGRLEGAMARWESAGILFMALVAALTAVQWL